MWCLVLQSGWLATFMPSVFLSTPTVCLSKALLGKGLSSEAAVALASLERVLPGFILHPYASTGQSCLG